MTLPSVTNTVSLVCAKFDKGNGAETPAPQTSPDLLAKAKGFMGVKFEGVAWEDPDVRVKCVEWTGDQDYPDYVATTPDVSNYFDANVAETVYSRQYRLFGDINVGLAPRPKCIEYVTCTLKPGVDYASFYTIWAERLKAVEACPGCCQISLGQQVDNPSGVVQIQGWMTLEDHIEGFKKRPDLEEIMEPLTEAVNKYVEGGWDGFNAYHLLL